MATTKQRFVQLTNSTLNGTGVLAAGSIIPLDASSAATVLQGTGGTIVDSQVDLSTAGYAKNGAFGLTLAISTPITVDLTNLSGAATVSSGDLVFATVNLIQIKNTGANPVIMSVGSSNPFTLPLAGTSPTITIPAGARLLFENLTGITVDSTHKTIKFDPSAAACSIVVAVGGA